MLLLQMKADGDVQKDEEQKQKGGDHMYAQFLHSLPDPSGPLHAPLPLNISAAPPPPNLPAALLLLCDAVAVPVTLAPSQAGA